MYITNRSHNNTSQDLIDEFLANGGKVTVYLAGETTEGIGYTNGFHRKKKPNSPTANTDNNDEN